MVQFLRSLGTVGFTLGVCALWLALGTAQTAAWTVARTDWRWMPAAVAAAVLTTALAGFTTVALRRPTPRWPWSGGLGGLLLGAALMAGTAALCGLAFGVSVTVSSDGDTRFGTIWSGWMMVGAAFLPIVAATEALVVGKSLEWAERSLGGAVRRVVVLVVAAHLAWLGLELVGWALA